MLPCSRTWFFKEESKRRLASALWRSDPSAQLKKDEKAIRPRKKFSAEGNYESESMLTVVIGNSQRAGVEYS